MCLRLVRLRWKPANSSGLSPRTYSYAEGLPDPSPCHHLRILAVSAQVLPLPSGAGCLEVMVLEVQVPSVAQASRSVGSTGTHVAGLQGMAAR